MAQGLGDLQIRDSLTEAIYIPASYELGLGQLEQAMVAALKALPLEKKIRQAVAQGVLAKADHFDRRLDFLRQAQKLKLVSELELGQILESDRLREEAIQVDSIEAAGPWPFIQRASA